MWPASSTRGSTSVKRASTSACWRSIFTTAESVRRHRGFRLGLNDTQDTTILGGKKRQPRQATTTSTIERRSVKTIAVTLLLTVLLVTAGAVAFVYSGIYDVSASAPHGALSRWMLDTTRRSSVERRAGRVDVPDLDDESRVLAGVNDFESMCVQCHGAPGKDPGEVGQGLNPPAPDLAESAGEMSAAELFWVTKHGIKMTGMPAWGNTHPDDALWPVVALIRTLPELDAAAYEDLVDRAEGMGHHAGDAAADGHEAGDERGEAADAEDAEESGHDHSTHDHD